MERTCLKQSGRQLISGLSSQAIAALRFSEASASLGWDMILGSHTVPMSAVVVVSGSGVVDRSSGTTSSAMGL